MLVGQGQYVLHFRNTGDAEEMLCIIGWDPDPTGVGWAANAGIAHEAYDRFAAVMLPYVAESTVLVEVAMELEVEDGTSSASWFESTPGGDTGSAVPQNTAYLIHKHTSLPGRGSNGRFYLPGVPEGRVNNSGVVPNATLDAFNSDVATMLATFDGEEMPYLVVNYGLRVDPTDPPPRIPTEQPPQLNRVINVIAMDASVATQRRRLRP